MDEKKLWHTPACRSLDAKATASDPTFTTDDSSNDDFVSLNSPDNSGAPDHSTQGQADFS